MELAINTYEALFLQKFGVYVTVLRRIGTFVTGLKHTFGIKEAEN